MTATNASPLEAALESVLRSEHTPEELEAKVASIAALVDVSAPQWVILFPGESTSHGRRYAYKAAGGKFVFNAPHRIVTTEELRIARARYLATCQHEIGTAIRRRFPKR